MGNRSSYALGIEHLTVSFDGFKAVDDLTFYVEQHEVRVVIGPNGAGKTTLLDLICGKTRATGGSVMFKNQELLGKAEQNIVKMGVSRKFQTPSIYPKLTVFENLELSHPTGRTVMGSLFFARTAEIKNRVEEVAREIYLADMLHTRGELLSHGQKQWLEIGMLLIADPELVMLDEPVAGMSVRERQQTAELLRRICSGRVVLVIEHDMNFVREIAHKVTVMHQGKLLAEGSMDEVQNNEKVIEVYLGH
ncbi:MAG TPA: urea ABC transporter ATP-binding protein UrtD [Tepidisphaeraceae bacterium]|jgi:urea transport system ATP-binding protein|nr:urea ABC transporter ATP-binding protein UrtD [Tepidisphaeraceae bacterium]